MLSLNKFCDNHIPFVMAPTYYLSLNYYPLFMIKIANGLLKQNRQLLKVMIPIVWTLKLQTFHCHRRQTPMMAILPRPIHEHLCEEESQALPYHQHFYKFLCHLALLLQKICLLGFREHQQHCCILTLKKSLGNLQGVKRSYFCRSLPVNGYGIR